MRNISNSKLIELLNSGFEGEVMFSGWVHLSSEGGIAYMGCGDFFLSTNALKRYSISDKLHNLNFKPIGKSSAYHHLDRGTIIIPIEHQMVIELSPESIKY
jgi:hypothetical protein